MRKHTKHAKRRNGNINLHDDIDMIKRAFYATAKDVKGKANEAVYDSLDTLKTKSHDVENNVSDYVNDHPLKSLGIAALSGVLVGMYLIRRK